MGRINIKGSKQNADILRLAIQKNRIDSADIYKEVREQQEKLIDELHIPGYKAAYLMRHNIKAMCNKI
jgi:hypothetical protein